MTAKYSCVSLVSRGSGLLDFSYIEVDVETGFWKWKKKERITLATQNGIDFVYPKTGKHVFENHSGLRDAVRLYNMTSDKDKRVGL